MQAWTTLHDKIIILFNVARDGLAEKAEDSRLKGRKEMVERCWTTFQAAG